MKIELRKTSEVKPYEQNPRHNDQAVDAVAHSIKEYGFRQPMSWMPMASSLSATRAGRQRRSLAWKTCPSMSRPT